MNDGGSTAFDQRAVFSFLGDPKTYGAREVRRIDTHGAVVFLVGDDAYKVKRAVKFPFMDFSTLERRRLACEAEIAVNRQNAPGVYLETVPIVRRADRLVLGGRGEPVEWAVHMRRFDEEATLDRLAERQELSEDLATRLAAAVVRSHQRAPRRDGTAATASLGLYLDQNEAAFAADPNLFEPSRAKDLARDARAALAAMKDLLIARGAAGYARRCHGDLHLRNIALIAREPTLFDAVEFDDAIATGDILYDLAFLIMDLEERGLRPLANLVLNRYLWASDEAQLSGLAALPLFLSIRSAIRAKVVAAGLPYLEGQARARAAAEARRYFWFAEEFLAPRPAQLVAVGGLSGTGKSAFAAALAPLLGRAPGAVWLRSDIERKRLFHVETTDRLPQAAYAAGVGAEVYCRLRRGAGLALKSGHSVIVDAIHSRADEQTAVERSASELGVGFVGFWLEAPLEVRLKRIGNRRGDASDADAAVAIAQVAETPSGTGWRRLDASADVQRMLTAARLFLGLAPGKTTNMVNEIGPR